MPIPAGPAALGTPPPVYGPLPVVPLVPPAGVTASQFTMRWFASLPAMLETADAPQWHLLRYMSLLGDQADTLERIGERIGFIPPDEGGTGIPSALVDPDTADAAWLPWLAQTVGARISGLSVPVTRAVIDGAPGGWRAGAKGSIAAAARTVLTGSKSAKVYDHSTGAGIGAGGEWDVMVLTRLNESPTSAEVIGAVLAAGAAPAGVTIHHLAYTATWAQVTAAGITTWAARSGLTWRQLVTSGM